MPSSPLNLKAAAWGWRSAVPSWKRMVAVCGRNPTTDEARSFISLCRTQDEAEQNRDLFSGQFDIAGICNFFGSRLLVIFRCYKDAVNVHLSRQGTAPHRLQKSVHAHGITDLTVLFAGSKKE
jgi:hypothetical protein